MSILLFIVYFFLGIYWLKSWSKKHIKEEKYERLIIPAFVIRIVIAMFFGYYSKAIYDNDNWRYFQGSQEETNYLLHRFGYFFYEGIFDNNGYQGNPFTSFFFRNNSNLFFNDLRDNLILKFEAILNLFSGRNYYINQLLANIIFIFPLIALIKVFTYWLRPKYPLLIAFFFLFYPPMLVWVSNIHKDMVCLMCLSLLFYIGTFQRKKTGWKKWRNLFLMSFSFLLLLLLKNYMALALAASAFAFEIGSRFKKNGNRFYLITFCIILFVFALSSFFPNSINLPLLLSRKQNGFYDIGGAQPLHLLPLNGTLMSYIKDIPYLIPNVFLYPFHLRFWVSYSNILGFFSFMVFLFLIYHLFKHPLNNKTNTPLFTFFILGFCMLLYLIIGFTVPVYGAVLRYRAIPETFLYIVIAQKIDFERIDLYKILKKNIYSIFNKK